MLSGFSAPGAIYANAQKQADFKLTYLSIIIVIALAACYLVIASLGIDMFSKCKELAGIKTQEDLNKWLIATLGIAIAMPTTLLLIKLSGEYLNYIIAILFAIFGIVAASSVIHWNKKCTKEEASQKAYGGTILALAIALLIATILLLLRKRGITRAGMMDAGRSARDRMLARGKFRGLGRKVMNGRELYEGRKARRQT
jgi:hypothetical protein